MHGGAKGTGAPRGNKNAVKHGAYSKEAQYRRKELRAMLRQARKLIKTVA
jgi:glucans biosynthesis protein